MSPLVAYVLRGFSNRPFVRLLVVIAMIVVGATVAGVAALGNGLRSAFHFTGHDNRVVVMARGALAEKDSRLNLEIVPSTIVRNEVKRHSTEALVMNMLLRDGAVLIVQLRGLEHDGFDMHAAALTEGRMPNEGEPEILLGDTLRQQLGLGLGAKVKLINTDMTVVGFFRASGFYAGEAWTTRAFFQRDPRRVSLASIYLDTSSAADAVALAGKLSSDRSLQVAAATEPEFAGKTLLQFEHLFVGLSLVFVMVVCGAVLASASLIALLHRRRLPEFCVMRAIGFRARAISFIILVETELLVLIGGGIGIALAGFALRNYTVYTLSPFLTPIIFRAPLDLGLGLASLAVMIVIGIGGALIPIIRMRRTEITRGLRDE